MSNSVSIKICGINNLESAKACINADYVGLVFSKISKVCNSISSKKVNCFIPEKSKKLVFSLTLILV